MHFLLRAFLLFVLGVGAVMITVWIGIASDYFGHFGLMTTEQFWDRLKLIPVFEIVGVATLLSMLFPAAMYGINLQSNPDQPTHAVGFGSHPEFNVFMLSSLCVIPLLAVFPPDDLTRSETLFSPGQYIGCFFSLWLAHGTVNAVHVSMLRAKLGLKQRRIAEFGSSDVMLLGRDNAIEIALEEHFQGRQARAAAILRSNSALVSQGWPEGVYAVGKDPVWAVVIPSAEAQIGSSEVVVISRITGDVLFDGAAGK